MPTFTVEAVVGQRQYDTQHGPRVAYKLDGIFDKTPVRAAELSQKPETPAPMPGQSFEATMEDTQFGPRLKKVFSQGGGGGGGGGRYQDSPETRRSIQMQHAQKCAVEALKVAAAHGPYVPPNASDVAGHVKTIAQILFDQIEQVATSQAPVSRAA